MSNTGAPPRMRVASGVRGSEKHVAQKVARRQTASEEGDIVKVVLAEG